jgi:hypothetical protein
MDSPQAETTGVTQSERYLSALCRRSFLRLWTHSGVSRDQNTGHGNPLGKEICDVLAIFDNHVLIFSDKYCLFPEVAEIQLAWARWYRRAIADSAKQIFGAERWLREHPDRVFTDVSCKTKFPLAIPDPGSAIYHRIIVAHGASAACVRHFQGGPGSLVIDNLATGEEPFVVGKVGSNKQFVHVFDDVTLDAVLGVLDTIPDFIAYLDKKERLLTGDRHITAVGEEELLASYSVSLNEDGEHDFIIPESEQSVLFKEGHWAGFQRSTQRSLQVDANHISYSWDLLIEKFTHHTLTGTHRTTTQKSIADQERLYRWLARERRTRRRLLMKSFMGIILKTPKGFRAVRVVGPSAMNDPYYVFLVMPRTSDLTEDQYRDLRQWLLSQYCLVLKLNQPDAMNVVGIATECGDGGDNRTEDLVYVDFSEWTHDMEEHARSMQTQLGLLTRIEMFAGTEHEFPKKVDPLRGPGEHGGRKKRDSGTSKPRRHDDVLRAVRRYKR